MTEGVPKIENPHELLERSFRKQVALLPKELRKRWEDSCDELPQITEEFYARFQAFVEQRTQALDKTLEITGDVSPEILEEIRSVHDVIRNTYGDSNYFLGNGYTAEVYELPIAPHLCVKYIKDQAAYNENNHLRVEFSFLERLHNFRHEGVRAPLPYFIRIHPSEGHTYGMERVMGESLSQILERPGENQELIKLAKQMDRLDVRRRLVGYIQAMHSNFNVTHGDLFQRNVMLDESGNFFVIDFGKAKVEEIGQDHEERRKTDVATVTAEIGLFFEKLDKLEIE